ncbi:hypothetical protein [Pseudomonas aeruginosa]|uniref:hypothetical protein n=1 Tax=Pseudomonas aeruginosa TaxID=287 RepID=UPI00396F6BB9
MSGFKVIEQKNISDSLVSSIETRDVALWIRELGDIESTDPIIAFASLPWRAIFIENYNSNLVSALENASDFDSIETRRRGFVQIIDNDPTASQLPHRCLPVYLLNGKNEANATDFKSRLRHLSMLNVLQESQVRSVVVIGDGEDIIPPSLTELWKAGFQSYLTVCSQRQDATDLLTKWVESHSRAKVVNLLSLDITSAAIETVSKYRQTYPEHATIVRMKDRRGDFKNIDLSFVDDLQRPITENYKLIQLQDLSPLLPEELAEKDFIEFFQNTDSSWRPYRAGLPWIKDKTSGKKLLSLVSRLDTVGADENCIAYITAESGAGGTTCAHALGWELASKGYPVLVAKQFPFIPDALSISNFLTRAHQAFSADHGEESEPIGIESSKGSGSKKYETPWIIIFDVIHWQGRDGELLRFNQELIKSGRPVCTLIVSSPVVGLAFYTSPTFKRIAELNHALDERSTLELGQHLNRYLKVYGKARSQSQWNSFYRAHSIENLEGLASFWVILSFWIQGEYDLNESIQSWMFRKFCENTESKNIRLAVLEIAALSSERIPMPEGLLLKSDSEWPMSHLLEDRRTELASLGLVKVAANGERYWALIHDILGRYLINALFFDNEKRNDLGFSEARDAEHLRFLLLERVSKKPQLGEIRYRAVGEDFAKSIFKIDPAHGRANFMFFWRSVLKALDNMPAGLKNTSRVFRHHSAISRRRIAKFDEKANLVTPNERKSLLNAAIVDIRYALEFIQFESGSEPDINLYNSLANAYLDFAKIEAAQGASRDIVLEYMQAASQATRKAYEQNPSSPFVMETYVKHLLEETSLEAPDKAIAHCIEVLGVIFSALTSNAHTARNMQWQGLADEAIKKLFNLTPLDSLSADPVNSTDLLINAWKLLAGGSESGQLDLANASTTQQNAALKMLDHPIGRGNIQVLRLKYELVCITSPFDFKKQLELVEEVVLSTYQEPLQIRLEYAILLFQENRPVEADKIFRGLRQLWRTTEHYVQVPSRLRWLRVPGTENLQVVHAVAGSDYERRGLATVKEFVNIGVPFRVEEFGYRQLRPGMQFVAQVSFGHNGPFLRPVLVANSQEELGI